MSTTDPRTALRAARHVFPAANLAELADALDAMAAVFGDGMTAGHVGGHFSCTEAERIADVLHTSGHHEAAETWLDGHAEGDDDADALPEHIERKERQEAKQAAWWDEYTGESAARRILSDAGLTMPGMQVNRTTDGRGAVNVYAAPITGAAGIDTELPPVRLARAVELLTAHGWTITDGPNPATRRATKPAA